jgi:predicted MFS family arabinose efflux permease
MLYYMQNERILYAIVQDSTLTVQGRRHPHPHPDLCAETRSVWVAVLIILGLGHGVVLNVQNFAAQAISRGGEQGAAAAMYAFARQFGMALGVGVGGYVFQNVISLRLQQAGLDISITSVSEAFVAELY